MKYQQVMTSSRFNSLTPCGGGKKIGGEQISYVKANLMGSEPSRRCSDRKFSLDGTLETSRKSRCLSNLGFRPAIQEPVQQTSGRRVKLRDVLGGPLTNDASSLVT